jgi:hypothetical protein
MAEWKTRWMEVTPAIMTERRKGISEMDFMETSSESVCWIELFWIWVRGRNVVISNVT